MRTRPPPTRTRRLALATAAAVTAYKGSLVGHSDNNASEDTGHPRVTHHHNWFDNVNSRMGAQMLVENNVFRTGTVAVTTNRDSDVDGYANLRGNDLGGAATKVSRVGTFTTPPVSSVVASVTSGAGAGKL